MKARAEKLWECFELKPNPEGFTHMFSLTYGPFNDRATIGLPFMVNHGQDVVTFLITISRMLEHAAADWKEPIKWQTTRC